MPNVLENLRQGKLVDEDIKAIESLAAELSSNV